MIFYIMLYGVNNTGHNLRVHNLLDNEVAIKLATVIHY